MFSIKMNYNPRAINIYTDGSLKKREGGLGFMIEYPDGITRKIPLIGYKGTTINRMELIAVIKALKFTQKDPKSKNIYEIVIFSDSQYVVDCYKKVIYGFWQKNNWKKANGDDVSNKDLWKNLEREFRKVKKTIEIQKIAGHSGYEGNENADKLAKKSRKNILKKIDQNNKGGIIRNWLKIKENNSEIILSSIQNFILYIQRTKPKKIFFDVHVQVLKPKKYFGTRTIIKGKISKHNFHVGHIYDVMLDKDNYNNLIVYKITKDIGRPSDNKELIMEK